MANNYVARKNSQWLVISMLPDVCKTPRGASTPPVPYPVMAKLNDAAKVVPSVRSNRAPLVVFDQSIIPATLGDQAGSAKGVRSGTVGSTCTPKDHSKTVRAGGKPILRHDDEFWMNEKNTTGVVVGQTATPASSSEPDVVLQLEIEEEKSLWDAIKAFFPQKETRTPDNWGRGSWLAAGAMRNGNAQAYESMALSAGPETLRGFQDVYYEPTVQLANTLGMPGLGGRHAGSRTVKKPPQRPVLKNAPKKEVKAQKDDDGGKSKGKEYDGPCRIGPYITLQCPPGNDRHHIIPDYTLRYGTRADAIANVKRIKGMPTLNEGMSICLSRLEDKNTGRKEHKDAHDVDPKIAAIGLRSTVPGTIKISSVISQSLKVISKVKPECRSQIESVVEAQFGALHGDTLLRSTYPLPKQEVIDVLGTLAR